MKASDIPVKIDIPFASQAGADFAAVIPEAPTAPGRASWELGFPPQNMEPVAVGGIPPFGQDMNGVFLVSTAWLRWQAAGSPVPWDSAFSASVGGYPKGATVYAANGIGWWISMADDNVSNPDAAGANWLFVQVTQLWAGDPNGHVAGQGPSATSPPSLTWDTTDLVFWYCSVTGDAAHAVWQSVKDLKPIKSVAGANHAYDVNDNGFFILRSNSGVAMVDPLPGVGAVANGWTTGIYNNDPNANLTITTTTSLNGVALASLTLAPRQSTEVTADATGGLWCTVPPIPQVFSGQAVYVATSGTYAPGVYDVDTTAGPIVFQLELGGALGDNYVVRDVAGTFAANNCTIDPNGRTIEGQVGNFALDVDYTQLLLTRNVDTDWSLV